MKSVLVKNRGSLKLVRLNRPKRANSLNVDIVSRLTDVILEAIDNQTRTLVLRGAGNSFCSGFDLQGVENMTDEHVAQRILDVEKMLQLLYHAPMLTVALAHGRAFGAGADLVCACRWRVGTKNSEFCMPGLNFGIYLGTRRLTQRVGSDNAQRMLICSDVLPARIALGIGLLTDITEKNEWRDVIQTAQRAGAAIDFEYVAKMLEMTTVDTRAQDMHDLKQSVSKPGLVQRIVEYRKAMRASAGKPHNS